MEDVSFERMPTPNAEQDLQHKSNFFRGKGGNASMRPAMVKPTSFFTKPPQQQFRKKRGAL